MEFIIDNYIWFLAGGIILIMTLIGYIADKTEFIEKEQTKTKERKEKQEKKKKEKKSKAQEVFEKEIGNGDNLVLSEDEIMYPVTIETPGEDTPPEVDESFENQIDDGFYFEAPVAIEEPIEDQTPAEIEPASEGESVVDFPSSIGIDPEIITPLEDGILHLDSFAEENPVTEEPVTEEPSIEDPVVENVETPVEEIAPITSIDELEYNEPVVENVEEVAEITPESIPEIGSGIAPSPLETYDNVSDDDVWKF